MGRLVEIFGLGSGGQQIKLPQDEMEALADALEASVESLRSSDRSKLADWAGQLSDSLRRAAPTKMGASVPKIGGVRDPGTIAQRNKLSMDAPKPDEPKKKAAQDPDAQKVSDLLKGKSGPSDEPHLPDWMKDVDQMPVHGDVRSQPIKGKRGAPKKPGYDLKKAIRYQDKDDEPAERDPEYSDQDIDDFVDNPSKFHKAKNLGQVTRRDVRRSRAG